MFPATPGSAIPARPPARMMACRMMTRIDGSLPPIELKGQGMTHIETDERTPERRARDEQIAAEPPLPPPEIPADTKPTRMENHLGQRRRQPLALAGVVE